MDLDSEPGTEPPGVAPVSRWRQINLTFSDWQIAEDFAATRLAPELTAAEDHRAITAFWFIRKSETWRLRLLPGDRLAQVYALLASITDDHRTPRCHRARLPARGVRLRRGPGNDDRPHPLPR